MGRSTTVIRGRDPQATPRWRSGFHADEVIQRVRPREDLGYIANPHRGTTTFQRFNGDKLNPGLTWDDKKGPIVFKPFDGNLTNRRYPDTTLSYCRWLWTTLEPEKGQFRWDIIDGALKAGRARGQTVQMRVQPFIGQNIPTWYWENPKPKPPTVEVEHNDPRYLKHFGDMIRAFGERYDGHPDLEAFDIAYGGHCGETGGDATPETARKLVDVYLKSFKRTRLISMLGTHGGQYAAKHAHVGWRADCFGDLHLGGEGIVPKGLNWNHMYDIYAQLVHTSGIADRWKTAPVTLETCWTVGYWHQHGWDIDWILAQGLKYHTSVFMPKSSFIPEEWREKIAAFDRKLGYRFVVRQVRLPLEASPGKPIGVDAWIENVGVAPLYHDYGVALRFKQGRNVTVVPLAADPRTWLPGDGIIDERIVFPKSLRRGEVEIEIGIIDRESQVPRVSFANRGRNEDRWQPLTKMDVL
ncbi:MAG: DUF4832 domain-containing protein [Planctomycetes bacterium]|nr:DUF4832 domain-containing protein [Planctomycetota bacterium]